LRRVARHVGGCAVFTASHSAPPGDQSAKRSLHALRAVRDSAATRARAAARRRKARSAKPYLRSAARFGLHPPLARTAGNCPRRSAPNLVRNAPTPKLSKMNSLPEWLF